MSKSRKIAEKSIRNINQKRKIKDKLRFIEGQSQQELQDNYRKHSSGGINNEH